MQSTQQTYDPAAIEPRVQAAWTEAGVYATPEPAAGQETAYILDMFPYPSASGIHVGHLLGYTGSDVLARFARMQGKAVLHPMGWDAFGLPAENFAIKTNVHPAISTVQSIQNYKQQIGNIALSYDWSKELSTTDPQYYRWTQWLFGLLYDRGLAYRKEGMVNWCSSCQTVLANEQVVGGSCERCGTAVTQRMLKQWYFKITDYAERLLQDLDTLDWPEKIKTMQRNWIGKSEGAHIPFTTKSADVTLTVFTTRPDTLFGVTYVVLAPEHPAVAALTTPEQATAVAAYQETAARKSELERSMQDKEKTGVFTGGYVAHPITGDPIPVWVADYVLNSYGTGAVMAVPAHDERDAAFAAVYDLPVVQAVDEAGRVIAPSEFAQYNGFPADRVGELVTAAGGTMATTYRLRDWLVSRQRFWGAPIPVAYDEAGNEHLIPADQLPVELPMDIDFKPTGQSPLVDAATWRAYTDPASGEVWQREADTLDTFVCSSWYFLRFPNPNYQDGPFDREAAETWLPVTTYIGGAEHAVLHLLYARFFTKVLFDAGMISFQEPFTNLKNQGMILGPDHQKMSKSKGNVINPDSVIAEHGADALRMFELFMGPFDQEKPWSTTGIIGVRRFLDKLWNVVTAAGTGTSPEVALQIAHRVVHQVSDHTPAFRFNNAIANLMEGVNDLLALKSPIGHDAAVMIVTAVAPYAPHIAEALWSHLGGEGMVVQARMPQADAKYLVVSEVTYAIQVNGKLRGTVTMPADATEAEVIAAARELQAVQQHVTAEPRKIIFVPGKMVSFVV
jgi:leucyl-tRNA synthetase